MRTAFRELDRILRGEATRLPVLEREGLRFPLGSMAVVLGLLAAVYGASMGSFAAFRPSHLEYRWDLQLLASTVKVPLLFLLTLVVTFPSLYVFNALMGSRLTLLPVLRLLVAAVGVNLAVLASLGPIVAFFAASTTSYSFMVLLNVVVCAVSGALGLAFLLRTLHRLSYWQHLPEATLADEPAASGSPANAEPASVATHPSAGPLDRIDHVASQQHVAVVFRCWIVVFGLVGAQMGWVLRPFIGSPGSDFVWFRERHGNFFEAVVRTILSLFNVHLP